jgi:hypothetical protein
MILSWLATILSWLAMILSKLVGHGFKLVDRAPEALELNFTYILY